MIDLLYLSKLMTPRPLAEWHEDMGPMLWWEFPIEEAPYCGSPIDLGYEVIVQLTTEVHIQTSEIDETKDDPSFEQEGRVRRFMVGGWPGYHTHFTPIPMPEAPK